MLAWSCKDTNSSESQEVRTARTDSTATAQPPEQLRPLYTWVDKLRLRELPDIKSKVVVELHEGQELYYLEEKSDFTERINLRGQAFDEPWLKVRTADQKVGWIYGGGVKFYKGDINEYPTPYERCIQLSNNKQYKAASDCDKKVQKAQLKKNQQYVSQSDEGITIRLRNGNEKQLLHIADEAVEGPPHTYDYRYYLPKMGFHVVQIHTHDKGAYLLVNDKSGGVTNLWGYPVPAPDHKRLLSYHADLDSGFEANGLQLFGFSGQGFEKIWEKELKDFEPIYARWLDKQTAEIHLRPYLAPSGSRPVKALLKADEGGWKLEL